MCCMLRRFLGGEVLPWFENRRKELTNRPLIREQALGEALDPDKLERLGRYDERNYATSTWQKVQHTRGPRR